MILWIRMMFICWKKKKGNFVGELLLFYIWRKLCKINVSSKVYLDTRRNPKDKPGRVLTASFSSCRAIGGDGEEILLLSRGTWVRTVLRGSRTPPGSFGQMTQSRGRPVQEDLFEETIYSKGRPVRRDDPFEETTCLRRPVRGHPFVSLGTRRRVTRLERGDQYVGPCVSRPTIDVTRPK